MANQDATATIMMGSQGLAVAAQTPATITYQDASCTMMQGSSTIGVASQGTVAGTMAFHFTSATATVSYPGTSPSLLLDKLSIPAVAAYSLRKLRAAYAGKAVNVRRISDSATQDIGFVGNDFDVASFNSFIGASTGVVATWYDQSANASNATARGADTTRQPAIVLSVLGGKPIVRFTTAGTGGLQGFTAITAANVAPLSLAQVASRTSNQTAYGITIGLDGNAPAMTYNNAANSGITAGLANIGVITPAAATDNAFHAAVATMSAANLWTVTIDNSASSSGTEAGTSTGFTTLDVGGVASFVFVGDMAEALILNGLLSAGDIATMNSDQHSYYGF